MKIIYEPKVYLISAPCYVQHEVLRFAADEGIETVPDNKPWLVKKVQEMYGEKLVEIAGRVCYMSYGKGRKTNEEFIRNLVDSGHHSVLEHANWTLLITGISRSLSHEFVRHRHFSYSQLSQRYVDSKDVAFVLPPDISAPSDGLKEKAFEAWRLSCESALKAYALIEDWVDLKYDPMTIPKTLRTKLARQAARSVLPNCTETKLVVTGNARAWREFFEKRGTIHADVEIRRLAVVILNLLKVEAPVIFEDFNVNAEGIIERGRKEPVSSASA